MNGLLWLVNHPLRGNVMGILTSQNPDTPEGLESGLSVEIRRIPAKLPHSTELELRKLHRTRTDSARASALELSTIWYWKIGTTMSLYLEIGACNHIVYFTFPFYQALSLILPVTLFLSANIFVVVHSQEVPMQHLVYCKTKENSKEFVWQIIMADGEWCSEWG
jgi:hypothetical protein